MASGQTPSVKQPNDWKTIEPNDWQNVADEPASAHLLEEDRRQKGPVYERSAGGTAVIAPLPKWYSLEGLEDTAKRARNFLINQLPTVGGIGGGIIGGGAGLESGPGDVLTAGAGAAAGGALGEDAREALFEKLYPMQKKMSAKESAKNIGKSAAVQGLSELLPRIVGGMFRPATAVEKLSYVGKLGPHEDIAPAMREILKTEKVSGNKVTTVGQYLNVLKETKQRIGNEVNIALRNPVKVTVKEEAGAPYKFTRLSVDNPVSGTFYHGTKAPISSVAELAPDTFGSERGLYGLGTYVTDNPSVAAGYARTKGAGAAGRVFPVKLNGARLLDIEKEAPPPVKDIFRNAIAGIYRESPEEIKIPDGATGKTLYQMLQTAMEDESYYSSDALETLQDLDISLRGHGYDGVTHIGGKEGANHNVAIIFPDFGVGRPHGDIVSAGGSPFFPRPSATTREIPLAGAEADTTSISDRIKSLASKHPSEEETNPAKLASFKKRALMYESKPHTYGWLFDRRQVLNDELNRFYSLSTPGDKEIFLHNHPDFEADKAEADAIRDLIYPEMDKAARKPIGYYRDLQRKQGAIIAVENATQRRVDDLEAASNVQRGAPLRDRLNVSTYGTPPGRMGLAVHRLHSLVAKPNPVGGLDSAVKGAFGHSGMTAAGRVISSTPSIEIMSLPLRYLLTPDETPTGPKTTKLRRIVDDYRSAAQ